VPARCSADEGQPGDGRAAHAVMQKEAKLRTGRLISHCAMVSVPTYARRFVISDVALNIAPDTDEKRDICQNAIGSRARSALSCRR